jgi:hypothetical protein
MKPALKLVLFASAYALVSATLLVAQQRDPWKVIDMTPGYGAPPQWQCEEDMHDYYIRRFESSDGFGLSRMPQPPMLDRRGVLQLGGQRYSIERLELVGLQGGPEPVVYVPLRHALPFNRTDFQSRQLSAFEQRALKALRTGQTVERARGADADTIEVMGALRGDGSCLKCHKTAKEGDLLGAFTYRLRRVEDRR